MNADTALRELRWVTEGVMLYTDTRMIDEEGDTASDENAVFLVHNTSNVRYRIDRIPVNGEQRNVAFQHLLSVVISGTLIGDHPFLSRVDFWSPVYPSGSLQPVMFRVCRDTFDFSKADLDEKLLALYKIAQVLKWIEKNKLKHGNVTEDMVVVVDNELKLQKCGYENTDASDFDMYKAMWERLTGSPLLQDTFQKVVELFHKNEVPSHGDSVRFQKKLQEAESKVRSFESVTMCHKEISDLMAPAVLSNIINGQGREKWIALRKLVSFAQHYKVADVLIIVGLLYMDGLGVDRSATKAWEFFNMAHTIGGSQSAETLIKKLTASDDHMFQGEMAEMRGDNMNAAVKSYIHCEDILGIAHLGRLLIHARNQEVVTYGLEILKSPSMQTCGFAMVSLGDYYTDIENHCEAASWYEKGMNAGHPDAAFLAGRAFAAFEADDHSKSRNAFSVGWDLFGDERCQRNV